MDDRYRPQAWTPDPRDAIMLGGESPGPSIPFPFNLSVANFEFWRLSVIFSFRQARWVPWRTDLPQRARTLPPFWARSSAHPWLWSWILVSSTKVILKAVFGKLFGSNTITRWAAVGWWLHEHCPGKDRGVREWEASTQLWRCLRAGEQRYVWYFSSCWCIHIWLTFCLVLYISASWRTIGNVACPWHTLFTPKLRHEHLRLNFVYLSDPGPNPPPDT